MTIVDLLRPSVRVLTASRRTVIMPADLPSLQRSPMPRQRLSSTDVTEYLAGWRRSLRLDVGCSDHLAPLLGLIDYEGVKIGRGARKHRAT